MVFVFSFTQSLMAKEISTDILVEANLSFLSKSSIVGSAMAGEEVAASKLKSSPIGKMNGQSVQKLTDQALKTNSQKDIVVLREGKQAILLAHTFSGTKQIVLGVNSTAISLVFFHPSLLGLTPEQQEQLVPIIQEQVGFQKLLKRLHHTLERDSTTPLDYFIHPFLGKAVDRVVTQLIGSPKFKKTIDTMDIEEYKSQRMQEKEIEQDGFTVSCKNDKDEVLNSCTDATKLSINNPKAVYYGAYIDKDNSDILDAKEGLVNVEMGLYPPKFEVTSSKSTDFPLSTFGNNEKSYNLMLR
jgi:hypothetical protein